MEEKKLTDEEFIKALEFCINNTCSLECPIRSDTSCVQTLRIHALDLINRQQAKIERLTEENRKLNNEWDNTTKYCAELQKQVYELKKRLHWIWAIGVDYDGCDGVESLKELIDELVELTQVESKDLDEYFTYNTTQGGKMNILSIVRKIESKDTAKEIEKELADKGYFEYGQFTINGNDFIEIFKKRGVEVE